MIAFLLLLFVLANHLIARFSTRLPVATDGNLVTILSIDGGGIKGIILAVILKHLETTLQKKDPTTRIADYFDVVAGTSTGGLMTAMLTTPNPNNSNRPLFTAEEIIKFYKQEGPHIFNQTNSEWPLNGGPKYDGKYLHKIICKTLNQTRLNQALTKVVIPTFDIKLMWPTIFSSFKLETHPSLDAQLSDICIGTSAAPIYFSPIYFEKNNAEFNLIDGGAAAGNPVLVAISKVAQTMKANSSTEFLLLSLGIGTSKIVNKYNATMAANWSLIDWVVDLQDHALGPLPQITIHAAGDMTSYYLASLFQGLQAGKYYLRIEVQRLDLTTFIPQPEELTNAEALDRLAEILYEERQKRLAKRQLKFKRQALIEEIVRMPFAEVAS